jgi:hypothetical protein
LVNATSVAGSASKTEEQAAASPAPETAFSKNKDRFYELVNTVLNEAGSFSLDDRLKAFSSIQDMGLKGQLMGSGGVEAGHEYYKAMDKVYNTDIARRMDQLGQQDFNAMQATVARGDSLMPDLLKWFANLSEDDQKIYFTSQNGFDMAGNRQYANIDAYRNQIVKNTISEAAYRKTTPDLATALKNIDISKSGSDWSAQILSLFKTIGTKDLNSASPNSVFIPNMKPSLPSSYTPGNLLDRAA